MTSEILEMLAFIHMWKHLDWSEKHLVVFNKAGECLLI